VQVQDPVAPRQLQPRTPRDLETVCLKCLHKEPGKRYATAQGLADDLGRFLAGEPIRARPVGRLERTLKWVRRRPAQATLVALGVIGLAVLLGGALWYQDQRARSAEKELSDRRRLDGVRREVQEQIDQGRGALARQEWQAAKRYLSVALARVRDEPSLAELSTAAEQLLPEADRGLQEDGARSATRDRWRRFAVLRDDALFHATLATGEGLAANLKTTRRAARQAVGLFGVVPERAGPPVVGPSLTEGERGEVVKGCYELLLVLADAEAQVLPGQEPDPEQLRQALVILDGAGRLGYPAHPLRAYHLRRARYLEQLGQTRAAAREQEGAARRPPSTALDFYLGGEDQYKRGNVAAAVRDFESVLRLEPGHFWAQYFLSVGYLRLQRPGEARAGLTACLGQRPDFVWIYLLRGFAHIQLKEFETAEADFQQALLILKDRPSVDAEHVLYANRGVLRLQEGHLDNAVADLSRAIRLKDTEYQAHATLAQVYQKQKRHALAVEQLDRAIQLEPDLAVLYRLRAQVQTQRQAWGAALEDLGQASRKESGGAPSLTLARDHAQRGRILYQLKRYQEAVAAYGEAVKAHSRYAAASLGLAESLLKLGRYEEALAALERYDASGGKPAAEVWRTRGLVRAKLRRYPEALRDLTQALEIKPEDAAARAQRGWVYLGCNAPQLALLDFEEALRRDPAQANAYNGRGYARVQLGQYAPAVLDAEEALRRGPSTPQRLIDSARILAQASGRLEADGKRQGRPVPEACWQYRDRAVALLLQALTQARTDQERAGLWQERIDPDPAFDPIRGNPEFARIRAGGLPSSRQGRPAS
jgi:tetratricopeptide (TPR) repeat protein